VDATDTNPVAVANTHAAARCCGVGDHVRAWVSDGFRDVRDTYDAVFFEAPLATEDANLSDANRHDFGGKLLREVLSDLPAHLNPHGRMYLMSRPDLAPYFPANGLTSRVRRAFEAKASVAIHELWMEASGAMQADGASGCR
jgi:methylase of polypeptide subunit release factors